VALRSTPTRPAGGGLGGDDRGCRVQAGRGAAGGGGGDGTASVRGAGARQRKRQVEHPRSAWQPMAETREGPKGKGEGRVARGEDSGRGIERFLMKATRCVRSIRWAVGVNLERGSPGCRAVRDIAGASCS